MRYKMKKLALSAIVLVIFSLALTSLQVYAGPNLEPQKTPGVKETEKAIQRSTDGPAGKSEGQGKPEDKAGKKTNVKGVVTGFSATSLTVELKDGGSQTFVIDSNTQIKIPGPKQGKTGTIQVGAQVMVQAVKGAGDTLTARHVMVIPGKPAPVHHVGTVESYSAGKSITITADGKNYTFTLSSLTKILPEDRAAQLVVGARVTIISSRDVTGAAPSAKGIVVHPANSGPNPPEPSKP
jgi:hypothetical protein